MRTILSTTLTAAVLLSGAGMATAERIMTWVDADGVRHFSQSPPAGPVRHPPFLNARDRLQRGSPWN